ncbi:MAG: ribbon-helix-helix domain-containing protein [Pseudomonadota bacterium]
MGTGSLIKRSITLKGHRTSVALEPEFWAVLDALAAKKAMPLAQLVLTADLERDGGLASTLRVIALRAALEAEVPATLNGTAPNPLL